MGFHIEMIAVFRVDRRAGIMNGAERRITLVRLPTHGLNIVPVVTVDAVGRPLLGSPASGRRLAASALLRWLRPGGKVGPLPSCEVGILFAG